MKVKDSKRFVNISNIGRAICNIVFIFSIVAFSLLFSAGIILYRVQDFMIWCPELHEATISEYIYYYTNEFMTVHTMIAILFKYAFIFFVELVVSKIADKYFAFLKESENFITFKGSKILRIYGISRIFLSLITYVSFMLMDKYIFSLWEDKEIVTTNPIVSIVLGIIILTLGIIIKIENQKIVAQNDND